MAGHGYRNVLIVGGGVLGCATACHLARRGLAVTVLDRGTIGGTASGKVPVTRAHALPGLLPLAAEGMPVITGTGAWAATGSLRVAYNAERMIELRRRLVSLGGADVAASLLTPGQIHAAWPGLAPGDIEGGLFLPDDGVADERALTVALATAARGAGAVIYERMQVLSVEMAEGHVSGVLTAQGRIEARAVILCAGAESRLLAGDGILPLASVRRNGLRVSPVPEPGAELPVLSVPDYAIFCVADGPALELGGYEPDPAIWHEDQAEDAASFMQLFERALPRLPVLRDVPVVLHAAPACRTPDGHGIIGELPEIRGLFAGAGFAGDGIAVACGAARVLADWVAGEAPRGDLWPLDVRRFGPAHGDSRWVRARVLEAYARHDEPAWPGREYRSARPLRRSPLYPRLRVAGARFGEVMGYEQPGWFAMPGDAPGFGRLDGHEAVAREYRAARTGAALFDLSAGARFRLVGRDAASALDRLSASFVCGPPGTHARALMLNEAGGVEVDADVARLAADEFLISCAAACAVRAADWITRNMLADAQVRLLDDGAANTVMALAGEQAEPVLAMLADGDWQAAFPPGTVRRLRLAGTPVTALRRTFGGTEGFELHVPADYALTLYDALAAEGTGAGLVLGGVRALEALRLEAGCPAWGAELTPDHSPPEAGLGHLLRQEDAEYLGAAAIRAVAGRPLRKRLAGFMAPPSCELMGGEAIYRNDIRVGALVSGGFGHGLGKALGYGYVRSAYGVDDAFLAGGAFSLDVAGERVPCAAFLGAPREEHENIEETA